jgi:hypothetical protein
LFSLFVYAPVPSTSLHRVRRDKDGGEIGRKNFRYNQQQERYLCASYSFCPFCLRAVAVAACTRLRGSALRAERLTVKMAGYLENNDGQLRRLCPQPARSSAGDGAAVHGNTTRGDLRATHI